MIGNRATATGTSTYADRFRGLPGNYRPMLNLATSSIGLGTYLGDEDDAIDAAYARAIEAAVGSGINLIDSAVNYRLQRSERVIGATLARLINDGRIRREEVIVATKGGYVTFDGSMPVDPRRWFEENFVRTGIVGPGDLVQGSHCMTPRYLAAMIETSRRNLGLETIDIYYVHNPEAQLAAITREAFNDRLLSAFKQLEEAVQQGRIGCYGVATWNGFRTAMNDRSYLSLHEIVRVAHAAGGEDHHFKVIQLPYNLAMTEALTSQNQRLPDGSVGSLLAAAAQLGIAVCASASLLQGQLTRRLPDILKQTFPDIGSDAQRALQFVRSTPGINVALVGMSSIEHVEQNVQTAKHPPAAFNDLMKLFQRADA